MPAEEFVLDLLGSASECGRSRRVRLRIRLREARNVALLVRLGEEADPVESLDVVADGARRSRRPA